MSDRNRYRAFSQFMTCWLVGNTILFVAYLLAASAAILWLKVVLAIVTLLLSALGLGYLTICRELLKSRSLWISCGFFAIIMCTTASLILAFP